SWCPPCRAEMPSIEALAGKLSNANTEFVLLSLDEKFELAKNYVSKANLTLPVYYPAEKLPALFVTEGIPATFIFDENGNLIKQNNGADNYNTDYYVNLLTKK
ncbi:MAG: TlpA family protein disulfide reductase, partial [Chitinophagaceae bacterium]